MSHEQRHRSGSSGVQFIGSNKLGAKACCMSGVTNILQYALLSNLNNLIGSGGLSLHSNFLIAALCTRY